MTTFILHSTRELDNCIAMLRSLELPDKRNAWPKFTPYQVTIREYHRTRTLAQEALYRVWCREIAKVHMFQTPTMLTELDEDEVNYWLKMTLHGVDNSKGFPVPSNPRRGGVKGFAEYLTRVEVWAAEHGIDLPHPVDYSLAMSGIDERSQEGEA